MFLEALKLKSNQKFVNRLLVNRKPNFSVKKAKYIGVLLHSENQVDESSMKNYLSSMGFKAENISTLVYNPRVKDQELPNNVFTKKALGWRGKIKNENVKHFTEHKFDVLICYFLGNNNELYQIAAMSEANFKVGISDADERLFDLIINVKPENFNLFQKELKKYLTLLNKI